MIINRKIKDEIKKRLFEREDKKPAIVIYGPRQSGKTTLAREIFKEYPDGSVFYDCDLLETRELFSYERSNNLKSLLQGVRLVILDEAQKIKDIGVVLKIIVDTIPGTQIIATGSSSFDLSNSINEPLTGRKYEFHLMPLSFEEIAQGENNIVEKKAFMNRMLRFGGYPAIVLSGESEAQQKLKELTGSYLFKDIFMFQELRKPEILTQLLRLLAHQIGNEVSFQELAKALSVDQTIIQKYLFLLEVSFIVFRLGAFRRNLRSEVVKTRKVYFWDLGIRNSLVSNFRPPEGRDDLGFLWENFCISERMKIAGYKNNLSNKYFWRTYDQKEIDYIEEKDGKLFAYEFKWGNDKAKEPRLFRDTYPNSEYLLINRDNYLDFLK